MLTSGLDVLVIRAMWRISQKVCDHIIQFPLRFLCCGITQQAAPSLVDRWLTGLTPADIISTVEFDHTGNYLATGDKGGRVVLFERNETVGS